MSIIERFLAYAADFEKTLVDDDWSRLAQYISPDAVYRVESDLFGCELSGPDSIFTGMKKSLDGFDRNFPKREIALTKGPAVEGEDGDLESDAHVSSFRTDPARGRPVYSTPTPAVSARRSWVRWSSSSTPTTSASTPRWRTGCARPA